MTDNVIIGAHNTMTYLPLENWWVYPFNWIAKCQKKDYITLFLEGVRCFDLRVYNNNGKWNFRHGYCKYKGEDLFNVLETLQSFAEVTDDIVYIRLILEKGNELDEDRFKATCEEIKNSHYQNLTFYNTVKKEGWKTMYDFGNNLEICTYQHTSSMAQDSKGLCKLWPWLYDKLHREKNQDKVKKGINLFDFL